MKLTPETWGLVTLKVAKRALQWRAPGRPSSQEVDLLLKARPISKTNLKMINQHLKDREKRSNAVAAILDLVRWGGPDVAAAIKELERENHE